MSREIDKLLATEVMGWTFFKDPDNFKPGSWYYKGRIRDECDWNPSNKITHAWEIVEKMREDGWNVVVYVNPIPNSSGCVMHKGSENFSCLKVGAAIPFAISQCVVKAKGIEARDSR